MTFESNNSVESKEKPKFLYHGSVTPGIALLEPRKRFVPRAGVPERVYASPHPAFAVAHAFPWSSDEGIDLSLEGDTLVLSVPKGLVQRLEQPIYLYKIPSENFSFTTEESMQMTYHSELPAAPEEVVRFDSVIKAMEYFGGTVRILED